jgi:hypothetical protein
MFFRLAERRRIPDAMGRRPLRAAILASICAATSAFADPPADGRASGSRASGEGVMPQLLYWQTCFKRDGMRDLSVILEACDRLAASPGLLPNQREFLARWRVKLTTADQAQERSSGADAPKSAAAGERR